MLTLEVHTRTIGSLKVEGGEHLTLTILEERLTVAELIQRTVEEGIREEAMMRMKNMPQDMVPSKEVSELPNKNASAIPIDVQVQVQKALRAFQAGTYMVLIDDKRIKVLDEVITFMPTTRIQFVRLIPLAGG